MNAATAIRLARPASGADRGRFALTAGSTAAAGALLLAALHIVRMPAIDYPERIAAHRGLASYVTEAGLRPGVVIATLLLCVPVLALTLQALRVGSVARDRRMASLRLAGATPDDVRAIAGAEAGAAALAGGLLAGPAYLLLWLVAGVLPPSGARMLTAPDGLDLPAWLAVVPLAALAGALAGAAIHGRAVAEPLGVRRRARPQSPGRVNRGALVAGVALAVLALAGLRGAGAHGGGESLFLGLAIVGLLVAAFAGGPRLVLASSRRLARGRGAEALLADRRLRADARTAGRVAGVMFLCGLALGFESLLVAAQLLETNVSGQDLGFYFVGYGMAASVIVVAAAVALLTLLVGAADGLLDARRPLAALSALGVDERTLMRVLARQLATIAVPAIVAGALLGGPGLLGALGIGAGALVGGLARWWFFALGTALVAGVVTWAAARLAARLLRPMLRAAIDPENLRTA